MPLEFGHRTGSVDILDWDEGIVRGFGGLPDESKEEWYLPLQGIFINVDGRPEPVDRALVVFKRPEPTQVSAVLPMIAVIRDSMIPAEARLLTTVQQFRLPSDGATQVSAAGEIGWTAYDTKDKEQPYDFIYTIECWARYRTVAQMLLQMVMAAYPHRGHVKLYDGIENDRTYAVFQTALNDLTDVSSMVDRVCGFSLSLRAEAELTLDREPFSVPAFTGTQTTTPLPGVGGPGYQLVPGPGGVGLVPADQNGIPLAEGGQTNPVPGPGGLYGTGFPIIRQGVYGA